MRGLATRGNKSMCGIQPLLRRQSLLCSKSRGIKSLRRRGSLRCRQSMRSLSTRAGSKPLCRRRTLRSGKSVCRGRAVTEGCHG